MLRVISRAKKRHAYPTNSSSYQFALEVLVKQSAEGVKGWATMIVTMKAGNTQIRRRASSPIPREGEVDIPSDESDEDDGPFPISSHALLLSIK